MARIVALFTSHAAAQQAAQSLIAAGMPARVSYLLAEGDQEEDGLAVTGAESLHTAPGLEQRLEGLGLSGAAARRVMDQVAGGAVAAVLRLPGPGEAAMERLAAAGAIQVEQIF